MRVNWRMTAGVLAVLALLATACGETASSEGSSEASGSSGESGASEMSSETSSEGGSGGGELSGSLNGAGASSQAAAMQGWQAGFQEANPGVTINYDPIGSGGGREQFLQGAVAFAGSDAYLEEEELATSQEVCAGDGGAIDLPHYISPIAVAYNLPDIDTLNLSPQALGGIFAGTITNWNDDAIAQDNPDVELPDLNINPVHRSDDSGTTENFTSFLDAVAPDAWTYGVIETWPSEAGGEGGQGTSGVVQAVTAGEGSIGYADASQVGDLGTAAIGVGEEFVEYSPEAAAKVVEVSEQVPDRPEGDLAFDLARDTTESGVYPIVLVSYHIVCTQYEDQATADKVKEFMTYTGSEEGQQAAAEAAGSAPISQALRDQLSESIDMISAGG